MSNLNITDLSNDFSSNPLTGDVSVKKNIDAIKQSLKNLLFMNRFDKPFNPRIDSGLRDIMFENLPDPVMNTIISDKINYIISEYEPRVRIVKIEVKSLIDKNLITIDITFSLRNDSQANPQTLQISIERIR